MVATSALSEVERSEVLSVFLCNTEDKDEHDNCDLDNDAAEDYDDGGYPSIVTKHDDEGGDGNGGNSGQLWRSLVQELAQLWVRIIE